MPVVNVHRWAGTVVVNTANEQTFTDLVIDGPVNIVLGTTTGGTAWAAGTWSLLKYTGTLTFSAGLSIADVTVTPPAGLSAAAPEHDTLNKRITVKLT